MSLDIKFLKTPRKYVDTAIVPLFSDKKLGETAQKLDKTLSGFLKHALETHKKFKAKNGEDLILTLPPGVQFKYLVFLGLGKPETLDALSAETAAGKLFPSLEKHDAHHVALLACGHSDLTALNEAELAAHLAAGLKLRSYKFKKYKSPEEDEETDAFAKLDIIHTDYAQMEAFYEALVPVIEGIFTARDLVNEPPNYLHPESFVKFIVSELKPFGVELDILDESKLKKLGMGGILAVGQGSRIPPSMVIMRWNGFGKTKASKAPLALVGKGVTFDTGGLSLKPGAGMDEMKKDMGGAAAVVGTMKALALRKAKADVVAIVGLTENMPSSRAYRPGDIITSYAGKTVEVLNTDAEGRLVLMDALAYVQETYKAKTVIDLATLTGAIIVALGHEYCGTFTNDDTLWDELWEASTKTGEKLWRMPLDPVWKKEMESAVADLQNIGKTPRAAGSSTAAGFLEHFIEEDVSWAHMDIAGTAYRKNDQATAPKYGTGFGVRVLDRFVQDNYSFLE